MDKEEFCEICKTASVRPKAQSAPTVREGRILVVLVEK